LSAPAAERKLEPSLDREVMRRVDVTTRNQALAPSNDLESRHYFNGRGSVEGMNEEKTRALLDELLKDREAKVKARREEAVDMLRRFVDHEPETAREMPDALLRLAELTWELSRIEYLAAFDAYQKTPEKYRAPQPPVPDYAAPLRLYDRLLTKHADYARLDLVLYMKAFTVMEQGDEPAAIVLLSHLLDTYPESRFRPDAYMALGEHVFNDSYDFRKALDYYDHVLAFDESELFDLALFKSAWCLWQLGDKSAAATRFRRVLDLDGQRAKMSQKRRIKELQSEALEYLIQVFTEDERNRAADVRRFLSEIGGERHVERVLVKLSATYFEQARFDRGIEAYELLLTLDPASKDAPRYALAVARGYMAVDDFKKARAAYEKLAVDYAPSGTWASQQTEPGLVTETRASIERTLREQALTLHELGQRDQRKRDFEDARDLYALYLAHFDDSPESYKIGFYLGEILFHRLGEFSAAGDAYLKAARKNPAGELTKDALYNAIGAFERVRETDIARCAKDLSAPCPETDNDRKFGEAISLYAATFPNDPDLPEILFRQGKLYYDRRIYDPAVRMFGELLDKHPKSAFAAEAGELVLDSFNRAADYENIERWARKLKGAPAFASKEAQARLDGLILGAAFKLGEQLAEKGEHRKAAEAYLVASREFPGDARAPKAVYNAGIELTRAHDVRLADQAFSELVKRYPGSEEGALGASHAAAMYESIAQFGDAARFYDAYAAHFPDGPKAKDAGYNAVLLRLSAGDYGGAVRSGRKFLERYPKDMLADEVYFLIARAQGADGEHRDAAATYREYLKRTKAPDKRVEAQTRLGLALAAAGDARSAEAAFEASVDEAKRQKKLSEGRYFAAQARFLQGDSALAEFDAIRIEGDVPGLAARLKQKAKLLAKAAGIYSDVAEFGVAEWVTAALYKIGHSYELFARALGEAPLPPGLNEEEEQVYRDELSMFVVPMEERALSAYEGGYQKARSMAIYNHWTVAMREGLTRMNEVQYPALRELGADIAQGTDGTTLPIIDGLRARLPEKPQAKGATP
jgi:TolA-binding protein